MYPVQNIFAPEKKKYPIFQHIFTFKRINKANPSDIMTLYTQKIIFLMLLVFFFIFEYSIFRVDNNIAMLSTYTYKYFVVVFFFF